MLVHVTLACPRAYPLGANSTRRVLSGQMTQGLPRRELLEEVEREIVEGRLVIKG